MSFRFLLWGFNTFVCVCVLSRRAFRSRVGGLHFGVGDFWAFGLGWISTRDLQYGRLLGDRGFGSRVGLLGQLVLWGSAVL